MAQVVVADPEDAGLAALLAGLIEAAIADPAKAALLASMNGTVTIDVPDAEVEVGLRFERGVCRVESGRIPGSMLRLTMPADVLLDLPTVPLMAGLPSLLSSTGRSVVRKMITREVVIGGLRHIRLLTQLNRLLALT